MENSWIRDDRVKALLLIFFITVTIYSNSLGGRFVYDDEYFVVKNITLRNLDNIPSFFYNRSANAFADLSQDVYRPVTTITYAVDYALGKLNTFGYHLVNVLLHSFNAMLLFLFLYLVFGNIPLALMTSLFFACHPVQTEVVSWISGRASVLFLFFYLSALIFYVLFLRRSKKQYFIYSLVLYAFSLFSKEMAVTLPLVLIVYDLHFLRRDNDSLRSKICRYLPYFILTAFFIFIRAVVLKRVSQCDWWGGSPYNTFFTMSRVMIDYVKVLLVPVKLCAYRIIDISVSVAETRVLASLALLAISAAAIPFIFRASRRVSFAICFFFITMLPVSNIVPLKALMAERFLYLPSIGFCLCLALAVERIGRTGVFNKKRVFVTSLIAFIIILFYSSRTMIRNEDWKDAVTISKSIVAVSPLNPWGFTSLGTAYLEEEKYGEAVKSLKKAIALSRDYVSPKNALGFCYLKMDRYDDAIQFLKEALRLKPGDLEVINSLAVAYASQKKYEEAIKYLEESIRLEPSYVHAYLNLGSVYEHRREFDKALTEYRRVAQNTNSAQEIAISYIRIGDTYIKLGLKDKAREYYNKARDMCGRGLEELRKVAVDRMKISWN